MRLIDADALIEQIEEEAEHMTERAFKFAVWGLMNEIKHMPTIGRAGEWLYEISDLGLPWVKCSVCGKTMPEQSASNYCPVCGSRNK